MQCMSCNIEIPPAWKGCLERNVCPACNEAILNDDAVELMQGIKNALEKMDFDPQGLAGWLLSNYRMEKVGDGEPTGFYGKPVKNKLDDEEVRKNLKIADNPLQKFQKAAGVNSDLIAKYKSIAEEINSGNVEAEENYNNVDYIPEAEDP